MINSNVSKCPDCGDELKHYDSVKRMIRVAGGVKKWTHIRRLKCKQCNKIHRELPNFIAPHKHYVVDIIKGVLDGSITNKTLDYEDYPCERTVMRWLENLIGSKNL